MGIRESALNTVGALENNDFVRVVTGDGASRKALMQAMGRYVVEDYAMTAMGGSTQSIRTAIDKIGVEIAALESATYPPFDMSTF